MRALEVEEAEEIEFERQIAPVDAIVEPYCEVEDVAESDLKMGLYSKQIFQKVVFCILTRLYL